MIPLDQSWQRSWQGLAARGTGAEVYEALVIRYSESHRHYHTLQHLAECLNAFDSVRALAPHPAEVEMALWFHDAIYDVKGHDNELHSAEWASRTLREAGVASESVERIRTLILATRHAVLPVTPDEQVLVDIDLSILGARAERFAEYEAQIRSEYSYVPGWIFRRKRRAILRGFLDRERIYSTEHFHAALETRARENLSRTVTGRFGWGWLR